MKLALVALIFIGPTFRVGIARLKVNPDNSCIYIIFFGQVQTCLNGKNSSNKKKLQTNTQTDGFHYYIVVRLYKRLPLKVVLDWYRRDIT